MQIAMERTGAATPAPAKGGLLRERVTEISHYTDTLFSFRTTRSPAFRFESGQFAMIGLEVEGRPLLRAYSMASSKYDDHLEFFSIKVPHGPLTSRLRYILPGDEILVGPKPTGTLLLSNLEPGRRLLLLSTGTGFAPFASILRDPETYESFESIVLVNGARYVAELEYATQTVVELRGHELFGDLAGGKLIYYPAVTRDVFYRQGRVTDLVQSEKVFTDLGVPALDPAVDRAMICGNPGMLSDARALLAKAGFREGSSGEPGSYVIEKAFVER
jgi:ferredoxin--NADP+ reductase